ACTPSASNSGVERDMPLSHEEFEDLKSRIETTEPVGSLARILLADVLERQALLLTEKRQSNLAWIQRDYGYPVEEAERILKHVEAGGKLGNETRKCHKCRGSGSVHESRCMGFESVRCPNCHGSGRGNYMITLPTPQPVPAQEDPRPPSE